MLVLCCTALGPGYARTQGSSSSSSSIIVITEVAAADAVLLLAADADPQMAWSGGAREAGSRRESVLSKGSSGQSAAALPSCSTGVPDYQTTAYRRYARQHQRLLNLGTSARCSPGGASKASPSSSNASFTVGLAAHTPKEAAMLCARPLSRIAARPVGYPCAAARR